MARWPPPPSRVHFRADALPAQQKVKTSGIITYLVGALYLQGRLNVTAVWGRGHGPRSLRSADKKWAGHNSVSVNILAGAILYKLSLVMDVGRTAFSARADASRRQTLSVSGVKILQESFRKGFHGLLAHLSSAATRSFVDPVDEETSESSD